MSRITSDKNSLQVVLYLSQNGMCDHIGRSQVVPYLVGLSKIGYAIHIISLEKKFRTADFNEMDEILNESGIAWSRLTYHNDPPLISTVYDLLNILRYAIGVIKKKEVCFVHARDFPMALVAFAIKKLKGIGYIYDFRDFYADTGLEIKPYKFVYRAFKWMEPKLIKSARKIVCLTEEGRALLSNWYFNGGANAGSWFKVIPCCADFQLFDRDTISVGDIEKARKAIGLGDDFVLLYLGSMHDIYLPEEMLALFKQILRIRKNAKFVFLINNGQDIVEKASDSLGIDRSLLRFHTVDRNNVPAFLSLADISVVFIRASISKTGCSPTKLAELFALDIPVIANTGVGDLDSIISIEKNGSLVINDFDEDTLRHAAEQVITIKQERNIPIRENSMEFSLPVGVAGYSDVYHELMSDADREEGLRA